MGEKETEATAHEINSLSISKSVASRVRVAEFNVWSTYVAKVKRNPVDTFAYPEFKRELSIIDHIFEGLYNELVSKGNLARLDLPLVDDAMEYERNYIEDQDMLSFMRERFTGHGVTQRMISYGSLRNSEGKISEDLHGSVDPLYTFEETDLPALYLRHREGTISQTGYPIGPSVHLVGISWLPVRLYPALKQLSHQI